MRNITNKYEPIKLEKKYATTVTTKLIVTVKANSKSLFENKSPLRARTGTFQNEHRNHKPLRQL